MQRLDAGGDDDFAAVETAGQHRRARIEARDLDAFQAHRLIFRIDHPHRGMAILRGQGARRQRHAMALINVDLAGDGG